MASGDVLARWQAGDGIPPTSGFAPLIRRNNHLLASFDAASTESLDFADVFDRRYTGGGITIVLGWSAAAATSGDVMWETKIERHQDDTDDLDSDSFGTAKTAAGTAASVSGELQYTSIAHTDGAEIDSLAIGEDFRLRVSRLGGDGSDTMTGDAELKSIEIRES